MADSPHEEILDAAETRLRALSLDGVEKRVVRHTALDDTWVAGQAHFPMLAYGPVGIEAVVGGTNARDDLSLPVLVRILDRWPLEDPAFLPKRLKWRSVIRRAFISQRLAGAYLCQFQGGPVVEADLIRWGLHSMPLQFAVIVRDSRG